MKERRPTQEHSLESFRFFPHVAWALTIGFSLFVYTMTRNLTSAVQEYAAEPVQISPKTLPNPPVPRELAP